MILNLFAYPSNFGKAVIYKCDNFGNALSKQRNTLIDQFSASVQMREEDSLLFGGFNQPNYYSFENQEVRISASFLFALDLSGTLDPAVDLLMNASAYSYQGTNISYKTSLSSVSATSLQYIEPLPYEDIEVDNSGVFKFYLVSPEEHVRIYPTSVNLNTKTIGFTAIPSVPSGCWLEVFKYGNTQSSTPFPIYYEPVLRIDTSEGSFYPCLVDKMDFSMTEGYIKINCDFVCSIYDGSTRYEFVNSTQQKYPYSPIIPLHKSRILIKNYTNDIISTFDITDLNILPSLSMLVTQNIGVIPITEFSFSINNSMTPLYGNAQENMYRRFVRAYYSKQRKVTGTMTTLALRSAQPLFGRYPVLNNANNNGVQLFFRNQVFTIPYTIWKPGKIEVVQGDYVKLKFDWYAITRGREGQPLFTMEDAS